MIIDPGNRSYEWEAHVRRLWRPWAPSFQPFFAPLEAATEARTYGRVNLRACAVLVSSPILLLSVVVALFCWPRARDFLGVAELQMCWKVGWTLTLQDLERPWRLFEDKVLVLGRFWKSRASLGTAGRRESSEHQKIFDSFDTCFCFIFKILRPF